MHNFKELKIWKDSLQLAFDVYKTTREFPAEKRFGLTSQINRNIVSIPSNIAEGSSRNSSKDFGRFLEIALGSSFELETQFLIAENCGYITEQDCSQYIDRIGTIQKMTFGFKEKLNK
jgi:four helix bundle protein